MVIIIEYSHSQGSYINSLLLVAIYGNMYLINLRHWGVQYMFIEIQKIYTIIITLIL